MDIVVQSQRIEVSDPDVVYQPGEASAAAGEGVQQFNALLYSRNWAFIPSELQHRLAQMRLLCVGTGLGSMVVQLAARTGFQRYILCDGDTVAIDNLNRQAYLTSHVHENKAEATAATIRAVLPHAQIEVVPRFVGEADFHQLVPKVDLIINTIDLDSPAFLALNRVARAHRKTVLFPMNLGWGGALLVFAPGSESLDEFLAHGAVTSGSSSLEPTMGPRDSAGDSETQIVATRLIERVLAQLPAGIPSYLGDLLPTYQTRTSVTWPYDPQLGVAAHITAAITVRTCVDLVAGHPIRTAPEVIWCDPVAAIAPSPRATPAANGTVRTTATDPTGSVPVHVESRDHIAHTAVSPLAKRSAGPLMHIVESPSDRDAFPLRITDTGLEPVAAGSPYSVVRRPGTGLVVVTAQHGTLLPEEYVAISQYRLHQYVLAGLYDPELVEHWAGGEDPAMHTLAPHDLHFVVTDATGVLLCYMCVQSPLPDLSGRDAMDAGAGPSTTERAYAHMHDRGRPLFPTETEYGAALFSDHPALGLIPVAGVREVSRLVRNQSVEYTSLMQAATAETILAAARVLCDPQQRIEATLGCIAPDARRLLHVLGIPVAYAPHAPILGPNLGGGAQGEQLLWTADAHLEGRFWPFVVASADLRVEQQYLHQLDAALGRDSAETAIADLNNVRRGRPRIPSRYVTDPGLSYPVFWTADPFYSGQVRNG